MRHSMGTFARKEAGLDTAQKMLNHQSARQTETYAKLDADESVAEVILTAEKLLCEKIESGKVCATKCDQNENKLQ